jgi:hypothetical protein
MLTAEYVRECFNYDADTGALVWRERPLSHFSAPSYQLRCNARWVGKEAANIAKTGYKRVNIGGNLYLVHRIIWLLVQGEWPDCIDHINGDRTDNRLRNLRSVTKKENCRNARLSSSNTSGISGVSFSKRFQKWESYIGLGENRTKKLGFFATFAEAAEARRVAERELGYHPNHGRAA